MNWFMTQTAACNKWIGANILQNERLVKKVKRIRKRIRVVLVASRPRWKESLIDVDDESSSSPASCSWIHNTIDHPRTCRPVQTHRSTSVSFLSVSHTFKCVCSIYYDASENRLKGKTCIFHLVRLCRCVDLKANKTQDPLCFSFPFPSLSAWGLNEDLLCTLTFHTV